MVLAASQDTDQVSICESQSALVSVGSGARVDRDARIIRGVKVLGLVSNNSPRVIGVDSDEDHYSYTMESLRDGAPLYEGISVYIDHLESEYDPRSGKRLPSTKDRKLKDKFGKLVNVRVTESGMFADLQYLESHPMAAVVIEAAERMPDAFALSHHAYSRPEIRPDGKVMITKINHVESVDLIGERPGTTHGLFESLSKGSQNGMADTQMTGEQPGGNTATTEQQEMTLRDKLMDVLGNQELDDATLVKQLASLLGIQQTTEADGMTEEEKAAQAATSEADSASPLDNAIAKTQEADATAGEQKSVQQESAKRQPQQKSEGTLTLEARMKVLEERVAFGDRKDKAIKLLNASGIPVLESRVLALARAGSDDELQGLLDDYKQISSGGMPGSLPRSAPPKPTVNGAMTQESAAKGQQQDEKIEDVAAAVLNG